MLSKRVKKSLKPNGSWYFGRPSHFDLGYWIALYDQISSFSGHLTVFIAVLLVIIGTYLIFTAGSIVVLKLLRKMKTTTIM